ncbi:hypothetical protein Droror1_Dr00000266 [Drosera rotundifolia]
MHDQGRAIFFGGNPFDPVEFEGKDFVPGQANNTYIFAVWVWGMIIPGAIRVHDDILLAASEALAAQLSKENFSKGLLHPPLNNIRKIFPAHRGSILSMKVSLDGVATRTQAAKGNGNNDAAGSWKLILKLE